MTIKQLLQEANAIQIGIDATDWRQVIALAAETPGQWRLSRCFLS